jgi:hypothetical protein
MTTGTLNGRPHPTVTAAVAAGGTN